MSSLAIQLIVGLGNPGSEYNNTRHNAGTWLVEQLAEKYNAHFRTQTKFKGLCANATINGNTCKLLIPTTFMNHSGRSVAAMAKFHKIAPQHILIVHDDLDLSPGTARLKLNGGHGGHNGLRDIITDLGSREFQRLRIGIGHPQIATEVINYVLKPPTSSQLNDIQDAISKSIKIIPLLLQGEQQKAMRQLHIRNKLV